MDMLRAILIASLLTGATSAAQKVEGHVVSAANGADISGVRVALFRGHDPVYDAVTDSQGRFRIEDVQDGTYTADYRARGFRTVRSLTDPNPRPPFVVTAGGEPVHLEVKLDPLHQVSGRVVDSAGKAVPQATVWLMGELAQCNLKPCYPVFKQTKTGDKGEYVIADVEEAGPWLVAASAPDKWEAPAADGDRKLGWAETFYPDAPDPARAARVSPPKGGDLWNVDIKLAAMPVHTVHGTVPGADAKLPLSLSNGWGLTLHTETKAGGAFDFPAVVDGDWDVSTKWERDGVKPWGASLVPVKGRDIENAELRLNPPFALHGKVIFELPEGAARPESGGGGIILSYSSPLSADDGERFRVGMPNSQGDVTVDGVYPGNYHVFVLDPPAGPYLDSIRVGKIDAIVGEVAILSGATPLTITYKYDGGLVRGAVDNCGSARVLLLPVDRAWRPFTRITGCSANGQFEFAGVRPGEYYVAAVVEEIGPLRDEAFLARLPRVTVRAKESTTTAKLSVIAR
jgi:5-hydroxyisourate hydrolase-like protein (transthyretin family)